MLEGGTDLALEAAGDAAAAVEAREDPAFLASAAKCPFKGRRCVDFVERLCLQGGWYGMGLMAACSHEKTLTVDS